MSHLCAVPVRFGQGEHEQAVDRLDAYCSREDLVVHFKRMMQHRHERCVKMEEKTREMQREIAALRKADEQRHKREEQLIAAANGRRQVSCFPELQSERSSHSSHAGGGLSARTHTHSPGPPSSSCARMHAFSRPSIKSVCARLRSPAC